MKMRCRGSENTFQFSIRYNFMEGFKKAPTEVGAVKLAENAWIKGRQREDGRGDEMA